MTYTPSVARVVVEDFVCRGRAAPTRIYPSMLAFIVAKRQSAEAPEPRNAEVPKRHSRREHNGSARAEPQLPAACLALRGPTAAIGAKLDELSADARVLELREDCLRQVGGQLDE
ncbi:hypothetical protein GCM10027416_22480 [Okibacterium endophyticum]